MGAFLKDLRYALRQLAKAPGFTATVVLTLAVGIGATTAIFTLVYDVLLRPLPFDHPGQLVRMQERVAEIRDLYPNLPMSANHFEMWQRNAKTVQAMTVMGESSVPLGTGGHPQQVKMVDATVGIFAVFGVSPALGRAFTEQEDVPGHDHVAVLMHDLWRTQFGSDPQILGKTIRLNGFEYTVIGVMPAGFRLPYAEDSFDAGTDLTRPTEVLAPMAFSKEQLDEDMGDFNYYGVARLKPGVTAAQANEEIDSLEHRIQAGLPADEKATLTAFIDPLQTELVGNNRKPLLILLAAVAGLLLVGCMNISNLLLSRAVGQRQQLAVAAALGARRGDLMRMAMRETAVFAIAGGGLGLLLAMALVPLMHRYMPASLNYLGMPHVDWAGAGCALLLAVGSTLVAGLAPGWMARRMNPVEALRGEARMAGEGRSSKKLRRALVGVEVAVSVTLVLMTGLLTASLMRLMSVDRGFDAGQVVTARIDLPAKAYPSDKVGPGAPLRTAFYKRVLDAVDRLPGVQSAGVVSELPLNGDMWGDMARPMGDTRPFMELPAEHFRWISPGYMETIRLPLAEGRYLTASDEGKNFALVSENTAKELWPGKDAVGQQFTRGGTTEKAFTVIGVVKDARTITLAKPDPAMVYMPYWYRCDIGGGLAVRTKMGGAAMAGEVRKAIWSVDADASVPEVRALGGVVADSVANRRFEMDLLLLFAASALLLAGLGVYGVVTYSVVQRQQEIGLRLALGADKGSIYTLVLRDGLMPIAMGAGAGVVAAFAMARAIGSLLFEVSPYDPVVTGAAVAVLMAVGTMACLLPARRAAAVDPMEALRTE
jgi:predicted permease